MNRIAILGVLLAATAAAGQPPDELQRALAAQRAENARLQLLLETTTAQHRLDLAKREWLDGNVGRAQVLLDEVPQHLRGFEWRFLDQLLRGGRVTGLGAGDVGLGLAFRPGDREVVLVSASGDVFAWDVGPGQEHLFAVAARRLAAPLAQVRRAARSLDGNFAALADDSDEVVVVDLRTAQVVRKVTAPGAPVADLAFSRDGRRLAILVSDGVVVHDLEAGESIFAVGLRGSAGVSVDVGPAGDTLAIGYADGAVKVWHLESSRVVVRLEHPAAATRLRFHPEGDRLAVLAGERLRLWHMAGARPESVEPTGTPARVGGFAWSPDGTRLAAGVGAVVLVWDAGGRQLLETHRGHAERVRHVAFSTDARRLASLSDDLVLKVWDVPGSPAGKLFRGHLAAITALAWSPDATRLATAGADRTVKVWEVATRRAVVLLGTHPDAVTAVAFAPDGKQVATGCADGVARTWDASTGRLVGSLPDFKGAVTAVAFAPDGEHLAAVAEDGLLRVQRRADGKVAEVKLSERGLFGLAFKPDATELAVACSDLSDVAVRVLDPKTLKELRQLKGPRALPAVAFSPDGRTLAYGTTTGTRLLRPGVGELVLREVGGTFDMATALAFSPDGRRLATAGPGRVVRLWDTATGLELLASPEGIAGAALAFSPDGERLALGEAGGLVRIFEARARDYPKTFEDSAYHLAFSPDGRWMTTGLGRPAHLLQVWDLKAGRKGVVLDTTGGGLLSHQVYFSPDSSTVRTLQERREGDRSQFLVRFWDAATGRETARRTIEPPALPLHWHWIGTHLAVATARPGAEALEIHVWDALTGKLVQKLPEAGVRGQSLYLSPDGTRLLVAESPPRPGRPASASTLWDATTGKRLGDLARPAGKDAALARFAFDPTGRLLAGYATLAGDGPAGPAHALVVWDVAARKVVHQAAVARPGGPLAFTPDGKGVVTLEGGLATVYPVGQGEPTAVAVAPHLPFQGDHLAFTPDGKRLAVQGGLAQSSRVYLWDYPLPGPPDREGARRLDAIAANIDHRHEAGLALRDGNWYAAVFHLDRLLVQEPEQGELYRKRARALVGLEQHARAVPDLARAVQGNIVGVGNGLRAEDWQALAPHIEAALEKQPDRWPLLALRGHAAAGQGKWDPAVKAFARAVAQGGKDPVLLERYAFAALGAGDRLLYKKVCEQLLDAFPDPRDATTANNLAWASLVAPGVKVERPLTLARRAVAAATHAPAESRHAYLNTLALGLYRAGKLDEAEQAVADAIALAEGRASRLDNLLLAILNAKQGRKETGRAYLAQALSGLANDPAQAGNWEVRVEVAQLRAEADAALTE